MLTFDKVTYSSLLYPFLFYIFIEFIIFLYTCLGISFVRCKEYMICLTSFSKFLDVLPAFTCTIAIGILWSICLGVKILRLEWLETMVKFYRKYFAIECIKNSFSKFSGTFSFFCFFSGVSSFSCFLKFKISTNKWRWPLSACSREIVLL